LDFGIASDASLRVDGGIARRPPKPVTHKIDRSFQDVLPVVKQFLRLLGKGKGVQ
jgi:hypothetical protein